MNILPRVTMVALALASFSTAHAQAAPDNTKQNQVEVKNKPANADAQKNDTSDLEIAKQIRASVVADKSLSTYAHNVKIVAVDGKVTLNGVVHTEEEKQAVEAKAQAVVKKGSVVNHLKIAP